MGYHGDQDHNICPYRDYVIDAFNDNMPFDRIHARTTRRRFVARCDRRTRVIATGYNRLLQTSHEGGVQPKEYLAIYAADRIRNLSAVWMGATVGCAQCHDHKYDPFTSKDFYSLVAFFADVDEAQHFKTGSNALPHHAGAGNRCAQPLAARVAGRSRGRSQGDSVMTSRNSLRI